MSMKETKMFEDRTEWTDAIVPMGTARIAGAAQDPSVVRRTARNDVDVQLATVLQREGMSPSKAAETEVALTTTYIRYGSTVCLTMMFMAFSELHGDMYGRLTRQLMDLRWAQVNLYDKAVGV